MYFTIGVILYAMGYLWHRNSIHYNDWRDVLQLGFMVVGAALTSYSILSLTWIYLP